MFSNQSLSSEDHIENKFEEGQTKARVSFKAPPATSDAPCQKVQLLSTTIQSVKSTFTASISSQASGQARSESVGLSLKGEKIDKYEGARHSSTHIIGNAKIGSLVKTSDSHKMPSTAIGNMKAGAETVTVTSNRNAPLSTVSRQETPEQTARSSYQSDQLNQNLNYLRLQVQNGGLGRQPVLNVTGVASGLGGTASVKVQTESSTSEADARQISENRLDGTCSSLRRTLTNLREAELVTLPRIKASGGSGLTGFVAAKETSLSLGKAAFHMTMTNPDAKATAFCTELSAKSPQLGFLHERGNVIDLTDDSLPSFPSGNADQQRGEGGGQRKQYNSRLQDIQVDPKSCHEIPPSQVRGDSSGPVPFPISEPQNAVQHSPANIKLTPLLSGKSQPAVEVTSSTSDFTLSSVQGNTDMPMTQVSMSKTSGLHDSGDEVSQSVTVSLQKDQSIMHHGDVSPSLVGRVSETKKMPQADGVRTVGTPEKHPHPAVFSTKPIPSSMVVNLDEPCNMPHSGKIGKSGSTGAHGLSKRPSSLSELNPAGILQSGELQALLRTTQITGIMPKKITSPVAPRAPPYSSSSLASSAVTFTRDTTSMDDSAGPPNVTLVSPTSLNRRQLQELENALLHKRDHQGVGIKTATPSLLKEKNARVATQQKSQSDSSLPLPTWLPTSSSTSPAMSNSSETQTTLRIPNEPPKSMTGQISSVDTNSLSARKATRNPSQNVVNERGFSSLAAAQAFVVESRQNKTAEKSPSAKPRRHSKTPTIRDILSKEESLKNTLPVASAPANLPMQIILPVPPESSLITTNSEDGRTSLSNRDKFSTKSIATEGTETGSTLIISQGEQTHRLLGAGVLSGTAADIFVHGQPGFGLKAQHILEKPHKSLPSEAGLDSKAVDKGGVDVASGIFSGVNPSSHLKLGEGRTCESEREVTMKLSTSGKELNRTDLSDQKRAVNPPFTSLSDNNGQPKVTDVLSIILPTLSPKAGPSKSAQLAGTMASEGKSNIKQIYGDYESVAHPIHVAMTSAPAPTRAQEALSMSVTRQECLIMPDCDKEKGTRLHVKDTANGVLIKAEGMAQSVRLAAEQHHPHRRGGTETGEGQYAPMFVTSNLESPQARHRFHELRDESENDSRQYVHPVELLIAQPSQTGRDAVPISHCQPSNMTGGQPNLPSSRRTTQLEMSGSSKAKLALSKSHTAVCTQGSGDTIYPHHSDSKTLTIAHQSGNVQHHAPPSQLPSDVQRQTPHNQLLGSVQHQTPPTQLPCDIEYQTPPSQLSSDIQRQTPPTQLISHIRQRTPPTQPSSDVQHHAPPTQLSSNIQHQTPILSNILQSSPMLLRKGCHLKEDISTLSIKKRDFNFEEKGRISDPQKDTSDIDGPKMHYQTYPGMKSSVASHIPASTSVHDFKASHQYMETLSVNKPDASKGRITQVIDNMYQRLDDDDFPADSNHLGPMVVHRSSMRGKNWGRGPHQSEQSLGTSEDDGQGHRRSWPKKKGKRRRTISNNSDSDFQNNSCEKQSSDASGLESNTGKVQRRTKSKKDGGSRDRKRGTRLGASHCQPKRVKFSDVVTDEHPLVVGSSHSKAVAGRNVMTSSSVTTIRDGLYSSSSNFESQDNPCIASNSVGQGNGDNANRSTPQTILTLQQETQSRLLENHDTSVVQFEKESYSPRTGQLLGNGNGNCFDPTRWVARSPPDTEDYQRGKRESEALNDSPTHSDIARHYQGPYGIPRGFEPRKEAEAILTHSLHGDGKVIKMSRPTVDSHSISASHSHSQPASHPVSEHLDLERKELPDRGYPLPRNYSEEPMSSFEIISSSGYSKLAQQLRRRTASTPTSTDHGGASLLLPSSSSSVSHPSSSREAQDFLASPWQGGEELDMDLARLDRTLDPLVKSQITLQSDFKLAQMMGQRQSHSRSRHSSMDAGHQLLSEGRSGYTPQPTLQETSPQDLPPLYENSCLQEMTEVLLKTGNSERLLLSTYQEHLRLKKALAKATENQSRQRNLSAVDKQKSGSGIGEPDLMRRYSSMPSSPFEMEGVRRSPRALNMGKYGTPLSQQASRSRNASSQDGRSRNASGSYGMNQHYGDVLEPHWLVDLDPSLAEAYPSIEGFIPVGFSLDSDPVPGHVEGLRVRGYLECESDGHNRHRNLSSSSLGTELEHGMRSRNPSSSSLLRFIDQNNIRSRNPSGSSNRRSRPGSCSSDREFLEMNMIDFIGMGNSPLNQAWF